MRGNPIEVYKVMRGIDRVEVITFCPEVEISKTRRHKFEEWECARE